MNIWKMITHHKDRDGAIAWTKKNGRIAIGWGLVGDISKYQSELQIKRTIPLKYPVPPYKKNEHLGAPSLWNFCNEMKSGDLVILAGHKKIRSLVVEVTGNYEYIPGESPLEGHYYNQRQIQITALDPDKIWFAAGEAPGQPVYQTLIKCARPIDLGKL